jgi:hypothetical protein
MKFNQLIKWRDDCSPNYQYLATMFNLFVFNRDGIPVAEWACSCPNRVEYGRWSFYCVIDTLGPDSFDFQKIVSEWKQTVDARLRECYNE